MALCCSWDTLYLVTLCKKLEWRYGIPETPGILLHVEKSYNGVVVFLRHLVSGYSLKEVKENGVVLFLRHLVSCYSLQECKENGLWCS